MPGRYRLSPSRIARYYHFACDRFLRYAATPGGLREHEGIPRPPKEGNPVARAVLEGGYDLHGLGKAAAAHAKRLLGEN